METKEQQIILNFELSPQQNKISFDEINDALQDLNCLSFEVNTDKKPNYEKGFYLLMEYFDSLPDEEKPKVDKQLKKWGL